MANIDLTAITTPLCWLDDRTWAALKAHGGPYEYLNGEGAWSPSRSPVWGLGTVYRVKPGPKRETVRCHFFRGATLYQFTIDLIDGEPDWSSLKPVSEL